ncbi:unnamed protein product [Rotaria socialis]
MSHHNHEGEKVKVEDEPLQNGNHQHEPSNQKFLSIMNHLKTRVHRNKLAKLNSPDSPGDASSVNINGYTSSKSNKSQGQKSTRSEHKQIGHSVRFHRSSASLSILDEMTTNKDSIDNDHEKNDKIAKGLHNSILANGNKKVHRPENGLELRANSVPIKMNKKTDELELKFFKTNTFFLEIPYRSSLKTQTEKNRTKNFQIRDEDFHTIFGNVSSKEHLVIAYPCAWQKEIFMHGRVFLSTNHLSFYACFLHSEESVQIPYKDITSVTREESAVIIPNAIKLRTKNDDEYLFACYVPREKIFANIFRMWQNALLDRPLDFHQLRAIIVVDQRSPSESNIDSEEDINTVNSDDYIHKFNDVSQSNPAISNGVSKSESPSSARSSNSLPQPLDSSNGTVSSKSDIDTLTCPSSCLCENHLAKTYINQTFNFDVDTLYELIFGDNSCTRDFFAEQKYLDYTFGEWTLNTTNSKRERTVKYRTINQSILGTNMIQCRERHILEEEKPHSVYVVTTEAYSEGMKYADTFYILTRFCMVQKDAEHSSLLISAEPKFIKYVNVFIRAIIEKNIISSVGVEVSDRVRRLAAEQRKASDRQSVEKRISQPQQESPTKEATDIIAPEEKIEEIPSVTDTMLPKLEIALPKLEMPLPTPEKIITHESNQFNLNVIFAICFLLTQAVLWYKLFSLERIVIIPASFCSDYCKNIPK